MVLWTVGVQILTLALGKLRQADLCEFEANLVYRASSCTVKATQRNLVSETKNQNSRELPWEYTAGDN